MGLQKNCAAPINSTIIAEDGDLCAMRSEEAEDGDVCTTRREEAGGMVLVEKIEVLGR